MLKLKRKGFKKMHTLINCKDVKNLDPEDKDTVEMCMEEILKILEENKGEMGVDALVKKIRASGILNTTNAIKNRLIRMEEKNLIEVKNFRVMIKR